MRGYVQVNKQKYTHKHARSPKHTTGKYGNYESYGKIQGSAGEGRHDVVCGLPGGIPRRHDGGPPVEGRRAPWHLFVECLGVSQKETRLSAPCGRETLGRSLGSHDAAELVGGMCHGNGCRQETTRLHDISCTKTGWSFLTHNRVLHQALARSLRERKFQFVVEDT